jgi:hypothetical protein
MKMKATPGESIDNLTELPLDFEMRIAMQRGKVPMSVEGMLAFAMVDADLRTCGARADADFLAELLESYGRLFDQRLLFEGQPFDEDMASFNARQAAGLARARDEEMKIGKHIGNAQSV